jgi:hypothetical protein
MVVLTVVVVVVVVGGWRAEHERESVRSMQMIEWVDGWMSWWMDG